MLYFGIWIVNAGLTSDTLKITGCQGRSNYQLHLLLSLLSTAKAKSQVS